LLIGFVDIDRRVLEEKLREYVRHRDALKNLKDSMLDQVQREGLSRFSSVASGAWTAQALHRVPSLSLVSEKVLSLTFTTVELRLSIRNRNQVLVTHWTTWTPGDLYAGVVSLETFGFKETSTCLGQGDLETEYSFILCFPPLPLQFTVTFSYLGALLKSPNWAVDLVVESNWLRRIGLLRSEASWTALVSLGPCSSRTLENATRSKGRDRCWVGNDEFANLRKTRESKKKRLYKNGFDF